ncbi:MAG: PPC domain-containing protein [Kiritimatiellae bacterium]|jgi:hypothetical protein|nr:PPC domain-containing protein [Kiritimatiellia bacterium]
MKRIITLSLALWLAVVALARNDPYIGFVYPAGGQRGKTFQVTLGGQFIHGTFKVLISGDGVTAKVIEYNKKIGPQTNRLLQEQRAELNYIEEEKRTPDQILMLTRLNKIIGEYVQQPACSSIANILIAEVTVAPNAVPGEREIRLLGASGLTNPMPFFVGQLPEVTPTPLPTSAKPILGKEALSLRKKKRPKKTDSKSKGKKNSSMMSNAMMDEDTMMSGMAMGESGALSDVDDAVLRLKQPCVINGQIGSGTVDRYLLPCRAGQDLVIDVKARVLVPYLADAVPGWFQPVIKLCDRSGKAVAYNDDYFFKPDPVLIYKIKKDGDYLLSIYDSIYRGREDFVYRMTIGSLPFVTSHFPMGGQIGQPVVVDIKGVNLVQEQVVPKTDVTQAQLCMLTGFGRDKVISNVFPFSLDAIPDGNEKEPNNSTGKAYMVDLPFIINGCINMPEDKDFYQFKGKKGEKVVAEVMARRLNSPLDSSLMIISPSGNCIGFNDDLMDIGSGLNTHHADSYVNVTLPEDGTYTCIITDTQHKGGNAYAYRLRLSAPQPDFDIRLVPSHVYMTSGGTDTLKAHLIRRDGFRGPVKLNLKGPEGFVLQAKPFGDTQTVMQVKIKTTLKGLDEPVKLVIEGEATVNGKTIKREAVAAEDRMQAFLWRHLVPAQELTAYIKRKAAAAKKAKKKAPGKSVKKVVKNKKKKK